METISCWGSARNTAMVPTFSSTQSMNIWLTVKFEIIGAKPDFWPKPNLGKSEIGRTYFTLYLDNQRASEDIAAREKYRTLAPTWLSKNYLKGCCVAKVLKISTISVICPILQISLAGIWSVLKYSEPDLIINSLELSQQ